MGEGKNQLKKCAWNGPIKIRRKIGEFKNQRENRDHS